MANVSDGGWNCSVRRGVGMGSLHVVTRFVGCSSWSVVVIIASRATVVFSCVVNTTVRLFFCIQTGKRHYPSLLPLKRLNLLKCDLAHRLHIYNFICLAFSSCDQAEALSQIASIVKHKSVDTGSLLCILNTLLGLR